MINSEDGHVAVFVDKDGFTNAQSKDGERVAELFTELECVVAGVVL